VLKDATQLTQSSRNDAIIAAIGTLREDPPSTLTMADLVDAEPDRSADLAGDVQATPDSPEPAQPTGYSKLRNSTWRLLEEQRMHAVETAQECDAAIKVLEAKRDDALRAAAACEAGQKVAETSSAY
jgi:hypothetical protein